MVQDVVDPSELARANGNANGRAMNGKPRAPVQADVEDDQTDENIFVFIPNLIGEKADIILQKQAHAHLTTM